MFLRPKLTPFSCRTTHTQDVETVDVERATSVAYAAEDARVGNDSGYEHVEIELIGSSRTGGTTGGKAGTRAGTRPPPTPLLHQPSKDDIAAWQELVCLFYQIDTDKDGVIQAEELRSFLRMPPSTTPGVATLRRHLSRSRVTGKGGNLFAAVDADGDNQITKQEVRHAARTGGHGCARSTRQAVGVVQSSHWRAPGRGIGAACSTAAAFVLTGTLTLSCCVHPRAVLLHALRGALAARPRLPRH